MRKNHYILIILLLSIISFLDISYSKEVYPFRINLFLEKQKYHNSEDLILNIQVKNITDDEIEFYIYDSPKRTDIFNREKGDNADYTTFKPVVYDMNGRNAELIAPYIISEKNSKETISWMNKRIVKLGPNETLMHSQNLRRIYNFDVDKNYRLKLHFFPFIGDADDENKIVISSNELSFQIVNDRQYAPRIEKNPDDMKLRPSEIINLLLSAEKDNQMERSFKYINIEKFIYSYPDFSRKYDLADDYDKKVIEKEFIRSFINKKNDYLLDYKILNEEIDSTGLISYVTVDASRSSMIKTQRLKYIYRLEKDSKNDYLWLVSGLEASIMRGGK